MKYISSRLTSAHCSAYLLGSFGDIKRVSWAFFCHLHDLHKRGHLFSHGLGVSMPRPFRKCMACHGSIHVCPFCCDKICCFIIWFFELFYVSMIVLDCLRKQKLQKILLHLWVPHLQCLLMLELGPKLYLFNAATYWPSSTAWSLTLRNFKLNGFLARMLMDCIFNFILYIFYICGRSRW